MKIKTIKFQKMNKIDIEKEREVKGMIIVLALFAASMIIGAGLFKNTSTDIIEITAIFNNFISMRSQQMAYQIFLNSFLINIVCIFAANFTGMSCIGFPFAVCIPVIKGVGNGFIAGYLFSKFAMSGIGYYLLTIIPGGILANVALLIACNDACFFSADILAVMLSKKQADDSLIKNYIKRNIIIVFISICASIIDCILVKAFAYLFVF